MSFALIDLLKKNISINLQRSASVILEQKGDKMPVNGYFDEELNSLSCAIGKPQYEWVPVFIHEYCHYLQWTKNLKLYKKYIKYNAGEKTDLWLARKLSLPRSEVSQCINLVRDFELDCEKRVVRLMKKYRV